ncbi:MAG: diguanylate cyclase domain-containing protein [Pseudonocardiaceae bacterium]
MNNTNDNAKIFDQIERYLTEIDADLDVEAGLRRLRLRMAEPIESPKQASGDDVSKSQDATTSDETAEAFPNDAATCHVIVHASSEDARQHANYVLRDLGLGPQEIWSTSKAISFRVSSDDVPAVRLLLEMTNVGWTVVLPGQLDYLLQSLYVEGPDPDQRKFRVADAPAQQARAQLDVIAHKVGDAAEALVDRVEDGTWQELREVDPSMTTHAGQEAFARRWAEAIVGTSYVSIGRNGLAKHLLGLTHQLVEAALAAEFDPSVGRRVGIDMVAAHFTGTETLSRTLALMAEGLPGLLGSAPPGVDAVGRVVQLTGNMAGGYAGALRERSINEQDAIYRAGLRARRQAEQALAVSEARFRAMFTDAAIGIGIGDLEGNITDANPALQRMFGYSLEEFTQLNFSAMVHPEDPASTWEIYGELIRGERDHCRTEKRFYRSDGAEIWTDLTVSLVRDETGAPAYQVALLEDVSERRRLQAELEHRTYHDPLTGLANRAMVTERLAQVFAEPAGQRRVGLCFLDLDGFKVINDSLGHDVGDQLLIAVASRLTRCCNSGQLVARIGGDEFVIIVEDTAGEHDVATLADRVLAAMAAPIRVGDHVLTVTTSIGVVEQPVADTNPADLMQAADITLYRAKTAGKARYAMFDHHRNDNEMPRFTLSTTMPAAVDRGELFVDDQPLVWLEDGALRRVEASVRWCHPTFGVLGPERLLLEPSRPAPAADA